MALEHTVLCGGTTRSTSGGREPLTLDIYGSAPNVFFRLEEVRRDLWREIPPVLRDLLDLAAYVVMLPESLSGLIAESGG